MSTQNTNAYLMPSVRAQKAYASRTVDQTPSRVGTMCYGCVPHSQNWLSVCLFIVTSYASIFVRHNGNSDMCVCVREKARASSMYVWMDGPSKSCASHSY